MNADHRDTTDDFYRDLLVDLATRQQSRFTELCGTGMPPHVAANQASRDFAWSRNQIVSAAADWIALQPLRLILPLKDLTNAE